MGTPSNAWRAARGVYVALIFLFRLFRIFFAKRRIKEELFLTSYKNRGTLDVNCYSVARYTLHGLKGNIR